MPRGAPGGGMMEGGGGEEVEKSSQKSHETGPSCCYRSWPNHDTIGP